MNESSMHETTSKQAIRDVLSRYCRGLDRMDKAMAYQVFSENSHAVYHGMYEGSGRGFVDWVWVSHEAMQRHSHQISNVLIEVDGDTATSESYVTVVLWTNPPEVSEIVVRGRYLDRWQCSDGLWQIVAREHVLDTQSTNGIPNVDAPNPQSQRSGADPSFDYIAPG